MILMKRSFLEPNGVKNLNYSDMCLSIKPKAFQVKKVYMKLAVGMIRKIFFIIIKTMACCK